MSDWSNFETWVEGGSLTAFDRANAIYRQTLAAFEPPELDASIRAELEAYVAERRGEIESARGRA